MKNLKEEFYNPAFSHIYVERAVMEHFRTKKILEKFPKAVVVEIDHYKDVFCRSGQDYGKQHKTQSLIIAAKTGELVYKGAAVCQSFGNEHFYYTSCTMNCIYDCEYCYLKGMYSSANVVIFVNLEDIFAEVDALLQKHPVYLCVSYDTDMMAMDYLAEYTRAWCDFAAEHENLKIEIRTKSANVSLVNKLPAIPQVILAFTVSPKEVTEKYEHFTPDLDLRVKCINEAISLGHQVRICFDPIIYCGDWQACYDEMLDLIFETVDMEKVLDVSVGSFRVSQDYLKKMRKLAPDSAVVQFPYENTKGVYHYPTALMEQMEQHVVKRLKEKVVKEKIFRWDS